MTPDLLKGLFIGAFLGAAYVVLMAALLRRSHD